MTTTQNAQAIARRNFVTVLEVAAGVQTPALCAYHITVRFSSRTYTAAVAVTRCGARVVTLRTAAGNLVRRPPVGADPCQVYPGDAVRCHVGRTARAIAAELAAKVAA